MKIFNAGKTVPGGSLVLVGKKSSSFDAWISEAKDREYLKFCIEDDKKTILLNHYPNWIFIHLIDEETERVISMETTRKAGKSIADMANARKLEVLTVIDVEEEADFTLALAEGLALSTYQFRKYLSNGEEKKHTLAEIGIHSIKLHDRSIRELDNLCKAVYWARDLVNEPLSTLTAVELSREIEEKGKMAGFGVEVFHQKKIESLRMGGLLAVNKGSVDPPTFSILTWKPDKAVNEKPVVLVGKGVVFDTGGLSLKPTHDSMDYMKCDMAGAATVVAAIYALALNRVPVNVIGLVPATDNRPDGNAYVPGDVIRMFNGSTVEVLNTDAEGRMILADALSWSDRYEPELVIDVATLTGAAHAAVGKYGIVSMGNAPREKMDVLKKSGDEVFERIAEFPFWDEYDELLKSEIADLKNIGGRYAGAITAGKFLEHFTTAPFIHLDIAGPAYHKARDSYRGKGGSGTAVRLLYHYLKNYGE